METGATIAVLMEKDFNAWAGFTAADDKLPSFYYTEALSPSGSVFDFGDDEVAATLQFGG